MSACADAALRPEGVRLRLRADSLSVRGALLCLRQRLRDLAPPQTDFAAIELVLAEVMNNIVEHGFAGRPDGELSLCLRVAAGEVRVTVADSGPPLPGGAPPPCDVPPPGPREMPEGGFGWPLIHVLSRDLGYRREAGRNLLSFRLPLGGESRG